MPRACGVDLSIGCRHEKNAGPRQDTPRFRNEPRRLGHVFDGLEAHDDIEGLIAKGKPQRVAAHAGRHATEMSGLEIE